MLAAAGSAWAQNGAISGHVTDVSGSSVRNADIDIVSTTTKETQTVHTNDDGYFQFPSMTPGSYVLHAHASSFAPYTMNNLKLEVGTPRSLEIVLSPEKSVQQVEVTATAPELVTDNPNRGNVIESQFVQNTPLNVRNPLQLVNFAQGVTAFSTDSGNNDTSQALTNTFRINGGKLATTESLLDGGANTTGYDYNAAAAIPTVDSIQEFKVLTTAYSPEWGRTSGGIVTFATKSGTNNFHGSVFEYLRNSALDSNGYNANAAGEAKPHFQRNQFGYALGGPVAIPHLYDGKDRTFFFSNFEGLRQSQAGSFLGTVPTALERKGDFSQTYDTNGNLIVIYDPRTTMLDPTAPAGTTRYIRTPFAGNVIPSQYLNGTGAAILSNYPLPNRAGEGASSTDNFFSNATTASNQNNVNFRLDHRFSDRHSIFGRFNWFQRNNINPDPYGNGLSYEPGNQRLPGYNIMADHTWVLNPGMVFEHHFLYAHQESNRSPNSLGFDPTTLGFNGNTIAGLTATSFPEVTATRISSIGPEGGLEKDYGTILEYAASLTQLFGTHSFKYGFDFRHFSTGLDVAQELTATAAGNYSGGPNPQAAVGDSGSGVADLLLGAGTVSSGYAPGFVASHPYFAFYWQDDYHVVPKLTLTYGLRYNLELPDVEANNQYVYLNLNSASPLNTSVTSLGNLTGGPGFVGVNGTGRRLQKSQTLNFDPRFGFAYRFDDLTVIRGGFGIFHAPPVDLANASVGFSAVTTSNPTEANGVTPLFNLSNPFPNGLNQPTGNTLGLDTMLGQNISGVERDQHISYSEQWSLDIQRQLPDNFVVTLGYVGNNGRHLYQAVNYNQLPDADLKMGSSLLATVSNPFHGVITDATSSLSLPTVQAGQLLRPHPQFLNMTATSGIGASSYNALQLSVEHRFSHGLALLAAYTFSTMFDNVGDYLTTAALQDNNCPQCDRSISSQDLTHVIRISGQYELPIGHGKAWLNHGVASNVFGGFTVGSFYTYDSGLPVTLSSPNFCNCFGGGTSMRPTLTGKSIAPPGGRQIKNGGLYFNPAAFTTTAPYTFGNASRYLSDVRAPGTNNFDMLAARRFPLHDQLGLDFRAEFFNAFNRVQFAGPNTSISSSSFGEIFLTQANTAREIQASLRLSF
ncbi:carboxypeptidase regulatory-like domain-containing protein [Silvibacterium acidisoli]|uniref:carboxypeptidase regulatory-like domain-containing protein n=1 Tax=Acidobacteriaceae bacterium ZG23-2 TaxID=2883246 RepID=UPI00406CCD7F